MYLFNDNCTTGGSLTGVIVSCHVELSKIQQRKKKWRSKNEYTESLESNTAFQKLINSIKYSI